MEQNYVSEVSKFSTVYSHRSYGVEEPRGPGEVGRSAHLGQMKILSFLAAFIMAVSGIFSAFCQREFQYMRIISSFYLSVIATVVAIVDIPLNFDRVVIAKDVITKFFRVMTRISGRGIVLLFMACNLFGLLYDNDAHPYVAITIVIPVSTLGVFLIIYGYQKSTRIDILRQELMALREVRGDLAAQIQSYSTLQNDGLNPNDVRSMAYNLGKIELDYEELILLFGALTCEAPESERDIVTFGQIDEWSREGCMLLL